MLGNAVAEHNNFVTPPSSELPRGFRSSLCEHAQRRGDLSLEIASVANAPSQRHSGVPPQTKPVVASPFFVVARNERKRVTKQSLVTLFAISP